MSDRLECLNHPQLLPHLRERSNRLVQVHPVMSSRQLSPDTGFAFRYYRIEEADHVDTFIEQAVGEVLRQLGIV